MKRHIAAVATLALAASLASCGPPTVEAPPAAAPVPPGRPLVWEVTDADSTVHLVGAVHAVPVDLDWDRSQIDALLADADAVWFESLTDGGEEYAAGEAMKHDPVPLSERLDAPTLSRVHRLARGFGLDPDGLEHRTIWAVMMDLGAARARAGGNDYGAGVEGHVKANARDREWHDLESYPRQLRGYADLSDARLRELLVRQLDMYEGVRELPPVEAFAAEWAVGETLRLDAHVARMEAETPWFHETMLAARNRDWADALDTHMRGVGTDLVVVGAAHLTGPDRLQALLAARGYGVRRLDGPSGTPPNLSLKSFPAASPGAL